MNELLTINWSITTKCNYNCYYCYSHYDYNHLSYDISDKLINVTLFKLKQLKNPQRMIILGGEPTMCNRLNYISEEALTFCEDVVVVTNGSNLNVIRSLSDKLSINLSYHGQEVNSFIKLIKDIQKSHYIEISCVLDPKRINEIIALCSWCKDNNVVLEILPMVNNETQLSEFYDDSLLDKLHSDVYYYNNHMDMFNNGEITCLDVYKHCRDYIKTQQFKVCNQTSITISADGIYNPTCFTGQKYYRCHIEDNNALKYKLVCREPYCLYNRGAKDLSGWRQSPKQKKYWNTLCKQ